MDLFYFLEVLSVNMLDDDEYEKYRGATKMILLLIERYAREEGIEQGIEQGIDQGKEEELDFVCNLLEQGYSKEETLKILKERKSDFMKAK